jgi:hypothetical protein
MVFDGTLDEQGPDEGQEEQTSSSNLYNEFSKHFEQQTQPVAQKGINSQQSNKINNKLKGILAASTQGNKMSSGNEKDIQFEKMRDQGKLNMMKKKPGGEAAWENQKANPSVKEDREQSKNNGGSNLLADVSNNVTSAGQSKYIFNLNFNKKQYVITLI